MNTTGINQIIAKYEKFNAAIEFDTRINNLKGMIKELNDAQMKYYEEFISDLKSLEAPNMNTEIETAEIKKPFERDNLDLLELVCQLHSRALNYPSKEMHDAYIEARTELEKRLTFKSQSLPISNVDSMEEEKKYTEEEFIDFLVEELPQYDIDTSKWEYDFGDCCYGGAVEFLSRVINSEVETFKDAYIERNDAYNKAVELLRRAYTFNHEDMGWDLDYDEFMKPLK